MLKTYGVKRGARVKYMGRYGTVVGVYGGFLKIALDGDTLKNPTGAKRNVLVKRSFVDLMTRGGASSIQLVNNKKR